MVTTRNVEVGPIWSHADAKTKAKAYIDRRPWLEWTGHWNTTVPGRMSTINVYNRTSLEGFVSGDVDMGPIWNQQDAATKARAFIDEHPFLEWNGQWTSTIIDGRSTSVIGVRLRGGRRQGGAQADSPNPSGGAPTAPSAPPAAPSAPSAAPSAPSAGGDDCDKCVVCWEQPIDCTLVPCGHLCCCYERCGTVVEKCPVCRADIQQRVKTYRHGSC